MKFSKFLAIVLKDTLLQHPTDNYKHQRIIPGKVYVLPSEFAAYDGKQLKLIHEVTAKSNDKVLHVEVKPGKATLTNPEIESMTDPLKDPINDFPEADTPTDPFEGQVIKDSQESTEKDLRQLAVEMDKSYKNTKFLGFEQIGEMTKAQLEDYIKDTLYFKIYPYKVKMYGKSLTKSDLVEIATKGYLKRLKWPCNAAYKADDVMELLKKNHLDTEGDSSKRFERAWDAGIFLRDNIDKRK